MGEDVIIPDISVFCDLETTDIQRSKIPPVLVIEILSPSNTAMEMESKREKYKIHGIREYWLINPKFKTLCQFDLKNGTNMTYTGHASFESIVFKDLTVSLSDVFI